MSRMFCRNQRVCSQKMTMKSSKYFEKPLFPTISTHLNRCPPFQNSIFSSSTYHSGLAGIVKYATTGFGHL